MCERLVDMCTNAGTFLVAKWCRTLWNECTLTWFPTVTASRRLLRRLPIALNPFIDRWRCIIGIFLRWSHHFCSCSGLGIRFAVSTPKLVRPSISLWLWSNLCICLYKSSFQVYWSMTASLKVVLQLFLLSLYERNSEKSDFFSIVAQVDNCGGCMPTHVIFTKPA